MLRELDLERLNSLTKYPSIPTYHALGERGALLEEHVDLVDGPLIFTEKVDGTNTRVALLQSGEYVIGSREQLLHARGDLVFNPALGIVEAIRETADALADAAAVPDRSLTVYYFETFGGKITAASKQYTGSRAVSFRLFDVAEIPLSMLTEPVERIAAWRDEGGQNFAAEPELLSAAERLGLAVTPRVTPDGPLPTDIEGTAAWLAAAVPKTLVAIDDNAGGRPEGLVVRTAARERIAKIRFEDYRRHLKRRK